LKQGKAIIFCAPSGAGKTTLVNHLLNTMPEHLAFSISATTRKPRGEEKHGEAYYFLSVEEFKTKLSQGDFIEHEEVYENLFYGTLKSEIERIWSLGKAIIFDVDVVGGKNLKSYFKDNALMVFVQPPSIETLLERLSNRATDSPEAIAVRYKKAEFELGFAQYADKTILNKDLSISSKEAELVVKEFLGIYRCS
jgi:guanylate kinase